MKRLSLLFLLLVAARVFAQGGPPLLTDDPDPVPDRHFEINVFATAQSSAGATTYELPHFDINYGIANRFQLKWETGLAEVSQNGAHFGWETSLVGLKVRLLDGGERGLSIGTYPQVGLNVFSSQDPLLAQPTPYVILPIEVKLGLGKLALDGDFGAVAARGESGGWTYGVCFGYELSSHFELTGELHGTFGNALVFPAGLLAQIGTRAAINSTFAILASAGTSLWTPADAAATTIFLLGTRLTL